MSTEPSQPDIAVTKDLWTEVDQYFSERLLAADPVLDSVIEACEKAGLPSIAVSPNQGKLLELLVKLMDARSILELGTLGGYSTIWLARGMRPGGRLITLEIDPKHAEVARSNIARAGLQAVVDVRVGSALEILPQLGVQRLGPFDLIFIDADKQNIPAYFDWAVKLARPGSLIIVDNVVRDGAVIDPTNTDPNIQGVRRFIDQLGAERRASGTAIQTVGTKGYDGFAIVLVKPEA
jgi:predicted O-methyltransferase YrrM